MLLGVVLSAATASAQRLHVTRYSTAQGLPANQTLALFQDSHGYLWFGTTAGLARYDGSSFQVYTRADGLTGDTIEAITEDGAGRILVAAREGGVALVEGGRVSPLTGEGLAQIRARDLWRDAEGTVWIATDDAILRYRGGAATALLVPADVALESVRAVLRDRRGRLWIGDSVGLVQLSPRASRRIRSAGPVTTLIEDAAGSLWVGTTVGLYRLSGSELVAVRVPGSPQPTILGAATAPDGTLWFGSDRGALRVQAGNVRPFTASNGLTDGRVNAVLVDHEGNTWFGTDGGVAKLVPSSFATYTSADGLPGNFVIGVAPAGRQELWVATRDGLTRLDPAVGTSQTSRSDQIGVGPLNALAVSDKGRVAVGGRAAVALLTDRGWQYLGAGQGLPDVPVNAMTFTSDGLWIGTAHGLFRWDGQRLSSIGSRSLSSAEITALASDQQGRLWVATRTSGVFVQLGNTFAPRSLGLDGSGSIAVWALSSDRDGGMWAATNGAGLVRLGIEGQAVRLTRAGNGLASDFVQQVVVDHQRNVWAFTNRGLDRWDPVVGITHFDSADGLASMAGNPGAALADSRGQVWFGTPNGLIVHRPGEDTRVLVPPIVMILSVTAGGATASAEQLLTLPSSRSDITFVFTALSYREETSTRFQYRLRGHSEEWSRPTSDRRVAYVGLPPGAYTFEVQAINGSGLWSTHPDQVALRVLPAIWQTEWVKWIAIVLGLALVGMVFRRRLRQVDDERRRLRGIVDKRTRELVEKNTLLERMATTDELTGLPNRRFFLENLERELRKMTRLSTDQQISLLVIDLDHFKRVNDQFGHAAGDEVLRQVAQRLAQAVRATDLAARYGGEEFAILLPNTGPPGARFLGEKLRAEVESTQVRFDGTAIEVTISVGVASMRAPDRYDPETEEELLRRADEAMYQAKTGGRNRVAVSA